MAGSEFDQTLVQVRAAQHGDRAALSDLLERYLPWVRQTVALRLHRPVRTFADYEDTVQESLLDAFRSIDRFQERSESTFRNWMARIVENNIRDMQRRAAADKRGGGAVRAFRDVFTSEMSDPGLPARQPGPPTQARARELEARKEAALLGLSERHREVIILRDRCGMSHEEVAREMGLQKSETARALHFRATEKLRAVLADPQED